MHVLLLAASSIAGVLLLSREGIAGVLLLCREGIRGLARAICSRLPAARLIKDATGCQRWSAHTLADRELLSS